VLRDGVRQLTVTPSHFKMGRTSARLSRLERGLCLLVLTQSEISLVVQHVSGIGQPLVRTAMGSDRHSRH